MVEDMEAKRHWAVRKRSQPVVEDGLGEGEDRGRSQHVEQHQQHHRCTRRRLRRPHLVRLLLLLLLAIRGRGLSHRPFSRGQRRYRDGVTAVTRGSRERRDQESGEERRVERGNREDRTERLVSRCLPWLTGAVSVSAVGSSRTTRVGDMRGGVKEVRAE